MDSKNAVLVALHAHLNMWHINKIRYYATYVCFMFPATVALLHVMFGNMDVVFLVSIVLFFVLETVNHIMIPLTIPIVLVFVDTEGVTDERDTQALYRKSLKLSCDFTIRSRIRYYSATFQNLRKPMLKFCLDTLQSPDTNKLIHDALKSYPVQRKTTSMELKRKYTNADVFFVFKNKMIDNITERYIREHWYFFDNTNPLQVFLYERPADVASFLQKAYQTSIRQSISHNTPPS